MPKATRKKQVGFACPKCKRPLRSVGNDLQCGECSQTYPVSAGIPDFLAQASFTPAVSRIAKVMDLVAPIYESRLFVNTLLRLSGVRGGPKFMDTLAGYHSRNLKGITGSVLDVACGPATYSRRLATPTRNVFGIDISMGVLRQGMTYIARDGAPGVRLARARVEELPFEDAVFDGAVCSGSLHLFPDTVASLREIARTMKPGAPLSCQTFVPGHTIINRLLQKRTWLRTYELADWEKVLTEAGYEEFRPELDGILLTFSARKAVLRA